MAIALGQVIALSQTNNFKLYAELFFQDIDPYLDPIIEAMLICLGDPDTRVRYYACEAMYNVAKVAKESILRHFNPIFDQLCNMSIESDAPTKNGSALLNRLLKDILTEQSVDPRPHHDPLNSVSNHREQPLIDSKTSRFNLPGFLPLLTERMNVGERLSKSFLVDWISLLNSIPDLELIIYLPAFLGGLMEFLSDSNSDVKTITHVLLSDFLREIRLSARQDNTINDDGLWEPGKGVKIAYEPIINIMLPYLKSSEEEIQQTALRWIDEFINLAPDVILPMMPQLIESVLPCLAHPNINIQHSASECNKNLFSLVEDSYQTQPSPSIVAKSPVPSENASQRPPSELTSETNYESSEHQADTVSQKTAESRCQSRMDTEHDLFDYQLMVNSLTLQFLNTHESPRISSLDWLLMLHKKAPNKTFTPDDGTFPVLLKTLSDPSEEVVKRDLRLLAQISSHTDKEYFYKFMADLLSLFSTDRRLLENRGSLIIRQLCLSLDSEQIYRTFASILEKDKDLEFAAMMVQNLNLILMTSPELSDLRKRLKSLDSKDSQVLFSCLYKSWCHSSVSAFSLCLLAQSYEHAANLLHSMAELEISVAMLIQIDKLVQLLESPVFTYLRLQLLEPDRYPYLFKCMYGLLMLLPQSSAFVTLKNRLSCVSSMGFLSVNSTPSSGGSRYTDPIRRVLKSSDNKDAGLKFPELLSHFRGVQTRHEKSRKQGKISSNMS